MYKIYENIDTGSTQPNLPFKNTEKLFVPILNESPASLKPVMAVVPESTVNKKSVNFGSMTTIHEEDLVQNSNPAKRISYKAKQVSFDPSVQPTENNIQVLKLKS